MDQKKRYNSIEGNEIFRTTQEDLEKVLAMAKIHGYTSSQWDTITVVVEENTEKDITALIMKPDCNAYGSLIVKRNDLDPKERGYGLYQWWDLSSERNKTKK